MLTASENVCLEREKIRVLFDTHCDSQIREQVAEHLVSCADCRSAYEQLAADDSVIQKVEARNDNSSPTLTRPEVALRVQELLRQYGVSQVTAGGTQVNPADAIDMLGPSEDGESLGRLAGFDVVEVLGHGGMGVVFKAFDAKLNRFVAIKVLGGVYANNPLSRQRFLREARAVAAVVHEHVIGVFAVEEVNGVPVMVMEYVAGGTLQDRIRAKGTLEVDETLRIALHVAKGLQAAHSQGIIHRDIKPGNILLENDVERATITDFGLARAVDDVALTQDGTVAGTPEYMSPEQAQGLRVDYRSDFFSLGCLIYAMLTGHSPFRASSTLEAIRKVCDTKPRPVREINPGVSASVEAFINLLLQKDPNQRPQQSSEVIGMLEQLLAHRRDPLSPLDQPLLATVVEEPVVITTSNTARRYQKKAARSKYWPLWLTLGLVAVTGLVLFALLVADFLSFSLAMTKVVQNLDLSPSDPSVEQRLHNDSTALTPSPPTPQEINEVMAKADTTENLKQKLIVPSPTFEIPREYQTLDLEGNYVLRIKPAPGVEEYRWQFSQTGNVPLQEYRSELKTKFGTFTIYSETQLWKLFQPGEVIVACQARAGDKWSEPTSLRFILKSRAKSSSNANASQANRVDNALVKHSPNLVQVITTSALGTEEGKRGEPFQHRWEWRGYFPPGKPVFLVTLISESADSSPFKISEAGGEFHVGLTLSGVPLKEDSPDKRLNAKPTKVKLLLNNFLTKTETTMELDEFPSSWLSNFQDFELKQHLPSQTSLVTTPLRHVTPLLYLHPDNFKRSLPHHRLLSFGTDAQDRVHDRFRGHLLAAWLTQNPSNADAIYNFDDHSSYNMMRNFKVYATVPTPTASSGVSDEQRQTAEKARLEQVARRALLIDKFEEAYQTKPDHIHVLAIPLDTTTEIPLHWRWHIYVPPKLKIQLATADHDISETGFPKTRSKSFAEFTHLERQPSEAVFEVKLERNKKGDWFLICKDYSDRITNLDQQLVEPVWLEQKEQCRIWQTGYSEVVSFPPTQQAELLRILSQSKLYDKSLGLQIWLEEHKPEKP